MKNSAGLSSIIIILAVVFVLVAGSVYYYLNSKQSTTPESDNNQQNQTVENNDTSNKVETWEKGDFVIKGPYADAEVVDLGDGKYRMYYAVEPEVPGNNLEIYSAISTDGINWTKESGVRKQRSSFPDVVKLPGGKYRIYYSGPEGIKSSVSSDGLTLTDEPGIRVTKSEEGLNNIDTYGGQGTFQLDDGSFVMAYVVTIPGAFTKYMNKVPNNKTRIMYYATSKDGLVWEKKGIAIDARNETLNGHIDGAEWVKWDDGKVRLYFWGYMGVYHVNYENGKFSEPILDYRGDVAQNVVFSPNPPSDPTLMKINNKWYMYLGAHEKGIYYATLK